MHLNMQGLAEASEARTGKETRLRPQGNRRSDTGFAWRSLPAFPLIYLRGWGFIDLQLPGNSTPLASTGICTHTHVFAQAYTQTHYN